MQRKHMTPEEVKQAMQEASKQMKTPEGQAALEKARKDRGFKIKLLGTEDWDEKQVLPDNTQHNNMGGNEHGQNGDFR